MDAIYIIGSIAGVLFFGIVGAFIGDARGHQALGFWLGLLLGPIGLMIIAMQSDDRYSCPACGGSITPGKPRCKNCGVVIAEYQTNTAARPAAGVKKAFEPIPNSDPLARPTPRPHAIRMVKIKRAGGAA